jgi:hypothetical protein
VVHGLLVLISPVRHSTGGGQRQQPVYTGIVVNNFNFNVIEGGVGVNGEVACGAAISSFPARCSSLCKRRARPLSATISAVTTVQTLGPANIKIYHPSGPTPSDAAAEILRADPVSTATGTRRLSPRQRPSNCRRLSGRVVRLLQRWPSTWASYSPQRSAGPIPIIDTRGTC